MFKMVSILVLMDVTLQLFLKTNLNQGWYCFNLTFVSILVLLDVDLQPQQWREKSFNPCFTGCCSSTSRPGIIYNGWDWVSILVLLDVALQQSIYISPTVVLTCFNPCFTGCCSSTTHGEAYKITRIGVSILVLMDVTLQL